MRLSLVRAQWIRLVVAIIKLLACKISKIVYFLILIVLTGHLLPEPESYINYDLAVDIALFMHGNESADSMFDAYTGIDLSIILIIVVFCYISTMKLITNSKK